MPETPLYGLPFEDADDQPGHSITGGEAGTDPILAEVIEPELARIDGDVTQLGDRIDSIEDTGIPGWTYIDHAFTTGGNFTVDLTRGGDFPAGAFGMIRMAGIYRLNELGSIRVRINDISGDHRYGYTVREADGDLGPNDAQTDANQWFIGRGGQEYCTFDLTIYQTDAVSRCSYQATGTRVLSTSTTQWTTSWGNLTVSRQLTSLNIRPFLDSATAPNFEELRWYLEGFKLP